MTTDKLSPEAIATAAMDAAAMQALQAALKLNDNLVGLVRYYSRADAGKPEREAMLQEIKEKQEPLKRLLRAMLQHDPRLDIDQADWNSGPADQATARNNNTH